MSAELDRAVRGEEPGAPGLVVDPLGGKVHRAAGAGGRRAPQNRLGGATRVPHEHQVRVAPRSPHPGDRLRTYLRSLRGVIDPERDDQRSPRRDPQRFPGSLPRWSGGFTRRELPQEGEGEMDRLDPVEPGDMTG